MALPTKQALHPRGTTLLEAMIALSILLVGLLGMAQLQIWSLGSNQGARAQTQALAIARELAAGLERLPYDDPRLAATVSGATLPAGFGKALQPDGTLATSGFTAWSDAFSGVMPSVRADSTLDRDRVYTSQPAYLRNWSVWAPPGLAAPYVRIIAVSVVYHEQTFERPMEVTLLTQASNIGASLANAAAYR